MEREKETGERLGILGGTFNPVHNGHLHLAGEFAQRLGLSRVLLVPTKIPPHKRAENLADGAARLEMCRLAAAENPLFEVDSLELERGGKSYTADTLAEMKQKYPAAQLFFLMGSDMFLTLEAWWHFEEIARLAVLCACSRIQGEIEKLNAYARKLETRYGASCRIERIPVMEISSTQIREKIARGEDAGEDLPEKVWEYIREKKLYYPGCAKRQAESLQKRST